jgi:hypothetical protein
MCKKPAFIRDDFWIEKGRSPKIFSVGCKGLGAFDTLNFEE